MMRSPAGTVTSSNASARAAFVPGGRAARRGTDSTSARSTTARRYCGPRRTRQQRDEVVTGRSPHGHICRDTQGDRALAAGAEAFRGAFLLGPLAQDRSLALAVLMVHAA